MTSSHTSQQSPPPAMDDHKHSIQLLGSTSSAAPSILLNKPGQVSPHSSPPSTPSTQAEAIASKMTQLNLDQHSQPVVSPWKMLPSSTKACSSAASSTPATSISSTSTTSNGTKALDSQLADALGSSRERVFLLRQEQEMHDFVLDNTKQIMSLPLMNSYQRLLVHRCADTFGLERDVDPDTKTVSLKKSANTAIPQMRLIQVYNQQQTTLKPNDISPFAVLNRQGASSGTPVECPSPTMRSGSSSPVLDQSESSSSVAASASNAIPAQTPFRIMRRDPSNGSGNNANRNASAAASENGSSTDKRQKSRKDMSIEEREESYRQARQRIFGESEEAEGSIADTPSSKSTSSATAKDTNHASSSSSVNSNRNKAFTAMETNGAGADSTQTPVVRLGAEGSTLSTPLQQQTSFALNGVPYQPSGHFAAPHPAQPSSQTGPQISHVMSAAAPVFQSTQSGLMPNRMVSVPTAMSQHRWPSGNGVEGGGYQVGPHYYEPNSQFQPASYPLHQQQQQQQHQWQTLPQLREGVFASESPSSSLSRLSNGSASNLSNCDSFSPFPPTPSANSSVGVPSPAPSVSSSSVSSGGYKRGGDSVRSGRRGNRRGARSASTADEKRMSQSHRCDSPVSEVSTESSSTAESILGRRGLSTMSTGGDSDISFPIGSPTAAMTTARARRWLQGQQAHQNGQGPMMPIPNSLGSVASLPSGGRLNVADRRLFDPNAAKAGPGSSGGSSPSVVTGAGLNGSQLRSQSQSPVQQQGPVQHPQFTPQRLSRRTPQHAPQNAASQAHQQMVTPQPIHSMAPMQVPGSTPTQQQMMNHQQMNGMGLQGQQPILSPPSQGAMMMQMIMMVPAGAQQSDQPQPVWVPVWLPQPGGPANGVTSGGAQFQQAAGTQFAAPNQQAQPALQQAGPMSGPSPNGMQQQQRMGGNFTGVPHLSPHQGHLQQRGPRQQRQQGIGHAGPMQGMPKLQHQQAQQGPMLRLGATLPANRGDGSSYNGKTTRKESNGQAPTSSPSMASAIAGLPARPDWVLNNSNDCSKDKTIVPSTEADSLQGDGCTSTVDSSVASDTLSLVADAGQLTPRSLSRCSSISGQSRQSRRSRSASVLSNSSSRSSSLGPSASASNIGDERDEEERGEVEDSDDEADATEAEDYGDGKGRRSDDEIESESVV